MWNVVFQSLDAMEVGKPFKDAYRIDVSAAVDCCRYNAGAADKLSGDNIPIGELRKNV